MESLKPLDMNSVMDIKFIKEMFSSIQARTSALCFQCTTCTNGCPVVDLLPHQLMHAVRMGLKDLVLEARMLWACTECYNCTEGCPQGIEVCDVIYQLKNIAIKERKNLIPRGIRIFANALLDNGRTAEIMEWEREELELPELNGSGDDILKKLLTQMHLSEIINPKPKL